MFDLDALADFLASDRAPEGSMDLSELDGFMAGVIAGPEAIPPSDWLPMVWDDEEPDFLNRQEEDLILDAIGTRYHEIVAGLDATPPRYAPVFWQDIGGSTITEDWAAGFMQAVSLDPSAWAPILGKDETASLLIPIAAIAGLAIPEELGGDLSMPEDILNRLIDDGDTILPDCVVGLRSFWRKRGVVAQHWPFVPSRRRH